MATIIGTRHTSARSASVHISGSARHLVSRSVTPIPPFVSDTVRCAEAPPSHERERSLAQSDSASNGRDCLGVVLSDSSQEGKPLAPLCRDPGSTRVRAAGDRRSRGMAVEDTL